MVSGCLSSGETRQCHDLYTMRPEVRGGGKTGRGGGDPQTSMFVSDVTRPGAFSLLLLLLLMGSCLL